VTTILTQGVLPDGRSFKCAIGKAGIVDDKTEGDGATAAGKLPLKLVLYRPDRIAKPNTILMHSFL